MCVCACMWNASAGSSSAIHFCSFCLLTQNVDQHFILWPEQIVWSQGHASNVRFLNFSIYFFYNAISAATCNIHIFEKLEEKKKAYAKCQITELTGKCNVTELGVQKHQAVWLICTCYFVLITPAVMLCFFIDWKTSQGVGITKSYFLF